MFNISQPLIAAHAATPPGFVDTVIFTLATVNQHFYNVGDIVEGIHTHGFAQCKYLMDVQRRGIAFATVRAPFYTDMLADVRAGHLDSHEAMRLLVEIPGIGLVKAGFILQMTCGLAGCLDRHNQRILGIAAIRTPQTTEALWHRIRLHLNACADMGTPEDMWNGWCALIHRKYPDRFCCAEDVSWKHVLWTRSAEAPEKRCNCGG